jgi:FtsH-binding integral membrane protein
MKSATFWLMILLFGTIVQALGISLYSSISMTRWLVIGQPLALGVTLLGLVVVLWFAFRKRHRPGAIILAGIAFGAGYLAVFHIIGLTVFPGLLRDVDAQGYWLSLVRVFAAAVVIHTSLAAAVFGLSRVRWLSTTRVV